ncbi:MAG: hypothetical protein QME72_05995 [Rhodococcus sp. (in: high G+C Gram-positive bacteria)]|nr:hypothetical protein [Rhodococcus sp. (in: high G+C Gram-positive bacteria)]MDI6627254.1 hypothetical protein [Rhodococcus sp. (in: high G+C Gram-positive bacteria)]
MGYYTDRLNKKRAKQAQERQISYTQSARQHLREEADRWRKEAEQAEAIGQYEHAIECYRQVAAMNDAYAGATHEILLRRKAMGY